MVPFFFILCISPWFTAHASERAEIAATGKLLTLITGPIMVWFQFRNQPLRPLSGILFISSSRFVKKYDDFFRPFLIPRCDLLLLAVRSSVRFFVFLKEEKCAQTWEESAMNINHFVFRSFELGCNIFSYTKCFQSYFAWKAILFWFVKCSLKQW